MVGPRTIELGGTVEEAQVSLRSHDSYSFLQRVSAAGGKGEDGGLLVTGPTGTNVCDVWIVLVTVAR